MFSGLCMGSTRSRQTIRSWPRQHSSQGSTSAFFSPAMGRTSSLPRAKRPASRQAALTRREPALLACLCSHLSLLAEPACVVGLYCWRFSRIAFPCTWLTAALWRTCVHCGSPGLAVDRPINNHRPSGAADCHLRWLIHDLSLTRNSLLAMLRWLRHQWYCPHAG